MDILIRFGHRLTIREIPEILTSDKECVTKTLNSNLASDKTPAHIVLFVKMVLTKYTMPMFGHPICSPDQAVGGFYFFLKVKYALKG